MMKLRSVLLLLFGTLAMMAEGLDGKWSATVASPNGDVAAVYEFKVVEGKITGSVMADTGSATITEGTLTGDDVTFVVTAEMDGRERKFKHSGKLAGDTLDLKIDFNGQLVPVKAKRVP